MCFLATTGSFSNKNDRFSMDFKHEDLERLFFFFGGGLGPRSERFFFFFLLAIIWFGTPGFHFCTFGTLPCRSARPMRAPQGSLEVKAQPILG